VGVTAKELTAEGREGRKQKKAAPVPLFTLNPSEVGRARGATEAADVYCESASNECDLSFGYF
jgi:hypothetical protein